MKRRLLATLLSLAMVLTMLPVSAFAAEPTDGSFTVTSAKAVVNADDSTKAELTIVIENEKGSGEFYYKPTTNSSDSVSANETINVDDSNYKAVPEGGKIADWAVSNTHVLLAYAATPAASGTATVTAVPASLTEVTFLVPKLTGVTATVNELAVDPTEGATVDFAAEPDLATGSSFKVKKVTVSGQEPDATEDITEDNRPAANDALDGYTAPDAETKGKDGDKFAVAVVTTDAVTAWDIVEVKENPATETTVNVAVTREAEDKVSVEVTKPAEGGSTGDSVTTFNAKADTTASEAADATITEAYNTSNKLGVTFGSSKYVNVYYADTANNEILWGTAEIPAWVKVAAADGATAITTVTPAGFAFVSGSADTITATVNGNYKPIILKNGAEDTSYEFVKDANNEGTYKLTLEGVTEDLSLTVGQKDAPVTNPGITIKTGMDASAESLLAADAEFESGANGYTATIEEEVEADTVYVTLSNDLTGATISANDGNVGADGAVTLKDGENTITVTVAGTPETKYIITITKKTLEPTIALYAGDATTGADLLTAAGANSYTATTDNAKVTLVVTNGTATNIKAYEADGTTELTSAVNGNTVTLDTEADTTVIKFTVDETNYTITVTKSSNAKTVTLKWSSDITVEDADGVTTKDYTVTNTAVEVNVTVASTKKVQLKEEVPGITVAAVNAEEGTYKVTIATTVANNASAELVAVDIQSGNEDEVADLEVTASVDDNNVPTLTVKDENGAPVSTYKYKVTATETEPTKPEANADTSDYIDTTPIKAITANSWVEVITVDGEDNITAWGKAALTFKKPVVEEKTATLKWAEGITVDNANEAESEAKSKVITTTNAAEVPVTVTDTTKKPATTATGVTITEGSEAGKWTVTISAGTTGEISLTLEDNTQTDDNTVNNDTEVTDGVATGSVEKGDVDKAVNAAVADDKATEVELNFTATGNEDNVKSVNIEIPKDAVNSVATAKDENGTAKALDLVVNTPVGSVTLPSTEVKSINTQAADATTVVLVIASVEAERDDKLEVYDIAFHKDNAKGTEVKVSTPVMVSLKAPSTTEGLVVYLIEGTNKTPVAWNVKAEKGFVSFRAPHLSMYGVGLCEQVDSKTPDVTVGGEDVPFTNGVASKDLPDSNEIVLPGIADVTTVTRGGTPLKLGDDYTVTDVGTTKVVKFLTLAAGETAVVSFDYMGATFTLNAQKAAAPVTTLEVKQTATVTNGFAKVNISNMKPGYVYVVEATNGTTHLFNLLDGNDGTADIHVGAGNVVRVKEYTQAEFDKSGTAIVTIKLETELNKTPVGETE